MQDLPSTPTDLALARLSEDDLMHRRKEALEAYQEAKNKGKESADLERAYQDLEAEHNRRLKNKLPHT
ncbi:MAG: hypothetical protein LCI00_28850 [Chloroflexi bacterium]|nr:hypothetical protein [Chloroflexota bacterium]MCC6891557.1 hypothetical protein [Anaerolineae bacterium]